MVHCHDCGSNNTTQMHGPHGKTNIHSCHDCGATTDTSHQYMTEYQMQKHTAEKRAAKGFHGIIYHPTRFLVGESGKERVNITPIKKKHKSHNEEKFWDVSDYFGGKY